MATLKETISGMIADTRLGGGMSPGCAADIIIDTVLGEALSLAYDYMRQGVPMHTTVRFLEYVRERELGKAEATFKQEIEGAPTARGKG